jgi:hypothetical protein
MATVAQLDTRILQIEQDVSRLIQELTDLKMTRNSLTSPLLRLPNELLTGVVKFMLPKRGDQNRYLRDYYTATWVCRRLRLLFIGTPHLWTTIDIGAWNPLPNGGFFWGLPPRNIWTPLIARQFTERAAACQLNVAMTGTRLTQEAFELMCQVLPRAKTFELIDSEPQTERHFGEIGAQIIAPLLREMSLNHSPRFDGLCNMLSCPNLTSLNLYSILEGNKLPYVPALQILNMTHAYYPIANIHSFLRQTPEIREVSFENVVDGDFELSTALPELKLPHLSKVEIQESVEGAATLLHILPDPRDRISVGLKTDELENPLVPWSSTSGLNGLIMSRLMRIWGSRNDAADVLPIGIISYEGGSPSLGITFGEENAVYRSYNCFACTQSDPMLERAIILNLESVGALADGGQSMQDLLDFKRLWNVDWLEIKSTTDLDSEDVQIVELWIHNRAHSSRPLRGVDLVDCGEEGKPLFDRLYTNDVAGYVAWDGVIP